MSTKGTSASFDAEKAENAPAEVVENRELEKDIDDLQSSIDYDEGETKKVLRKVDRRLLPVLTLLYLLSFLDRGNGKLSHCLVV